MIVTFYKSDGTAISSSDIASHYNISCCCTAEDSFGAEELNDFNNNNKVLVLNDYTTWKQGTIAGNETNKVDSWKAIKVVPGHQYMFLFSNSAPLLKQFGVTGGKESPDTWLGWNALTTSSQMYSIKEYHTLWTAPTDVNYIRLTFMLANNASLTPEDVSSAKIVMVDVTPADYHIPSASVLLKQQQNNGRYAQGMAIDNGYIFQAFSDGYIDIYDIATRQLVQSVQFPNAEGISTTQHLNAIYFGAKYDDSDDFRTLWASPNAFEDKMVGVRISKNGDIFTFTKVYELTVPTISNSDYYTYTVFAGFANKKLILVAYKRTESAPYMGDNVIFVYDVSAWNNEAIFTLNTSFEINRMINVQSGFVIDNLLYLTIGGTSSSLQKFTSRICCIDYVAKNIRYIIDLHNPAYGYDYHDELQGFDSDGETFLVSSTKWVSGTSISETTIKKITF